MLRQPDGVECIVHIGGFELAKSLKPKCELLVHLAGKKKEDVPIGTEVWSVDRSPE